MTFRLYGPIYDEGPVAKFSSFKAAVLRGQKIYGRKRFHVECPEGYAPSREEQLLQEVNPGGRKRGDVEFDSVQQLKARREIQQLRKEIAGEMTDW